MSSNVAGKKPRSGDAAANLPHINFANLDFSGSNLLLVAAVAAAQQQQRQLLQLKQQQEQQKLLDEEKSTMDRTHNSTPSSVHSVVWQRSPPPPKDLANGAHVPLHKIRKLKLYSVDEKIDIIDYAKIIGNRAAGREFNVAESSIREWRKNEDRLRSQSERSANGARRMEVQHPDLIRELDSRLVDFIDSTSNVDWYAIRDKARDLWPAVVKNADLDEADRDVNITMGWVTRFMKRNEDRVPRIAPPVIATANAANGHNGSVTMVRKASPFPAESSSAAPDKAHESSQTSPSTLSGSPSPTLVNSTSRRKSAQPKRAADATLVLTPEKSDVEEGASPTKKAKPEVEKSETLLDSIIKVC